MIKTGLAVAKIVAKGVKKSKKVTGWKYLDRAENDADLAGQFESTKFRECVDDYVANFQLLNRNWLNSVTDLG